MSQGVSDRNIEFDFKREDFGVKDLFSKHLYWQQEGVIELLAQEMAAGRVIISSTDTVLGLLAPLSQEGYQSLNRIKKRSEKPYLILMGAQESVCRYVASDLLTDSICRLMAHCWPGPLTLIFKAKTGVADYIKAADNTIAIRIPDHAGLRLLLLNHDGFFSTSANLSGNRIPAMVEELDDSLVRAVKYIVTDQGLSEQKNLPSTILDCTGSRIRVVREGAYSLNELERIAGEVFLLS